MTRCVADLCRKENGDLIMYLSAFGHADYAENGKDIVCSAVSSLCTALANTLLAYGVPKVSLRVKEGNFLVDACITENHGQCEGAYEMACTGLAMIADQFPDHVFFARGESN